MPSLASCLAGVTLFYCLLLYDAPQKLFRDSDTGWHIRNGESILRTLTLPRTDPYSFTRYGQPWYAWEWGADVAMGAVHRVAGLSGVVWLFAVAIAACGYLWVRLNWAAGGNFFLASLLAAPMLSTANLHWLARPHIFSWLLLLGFLLYFEAAPPHFRRRDLLLNALGSALWTNLHASFFLLPVMALLYALGSALRLMLWDVDEGGEDRETTWRRVRWYSLAGLTALLASVLNPYALAMHLHVIRYLADSELLDRVGEFQSFNFHAAGSWQILVMLGVAAAGGLLALQQRKVAHFLLTAMLLALALQSARGLPIAALALLPLANGAFTAALRQSRGLRPAILRRLSGFLRYSDRLRLLESSFSGVVWTPLVLVLVYLWLKVPMVAARTGFSPEEFPVAAAGMLQVSPKARLLAPDKYGGYLIYRFDGKLRVFFDGRSDFYGSGFMKEYIRLVEVRPGWRRQVEEQRFTQALLPAEYSLIPALKEIGWVESYRDEVAVLLRPPRQPD